MAFMKDLSSALRRRPHEIPVAEVVQPESEKHSKEAASVRDAQDATGSDSDGIDVDAQPGIQKMEATTKTWTKPWLITAYML